MSRVNMKDNNLCFHMAANGDATEKTLLVNLEIHAEDLIVIKPGRKLNHGHTRWD
jgi:hypothetical protein